MTRFSLIAVLAVSAMSGTAIAQSGTNAPRTIIIRPGASSACPGDAIGAEYALVLADGTRRSLGPNEVKLVGSDAVQPAGKGSWKAASDPLYAAFTGYKLSARLASDTTIRGDTTLAPARECKHIPISIGTSTRYDAKSAHVRVGVLPTPFFDSVVVAVLEVDGQAPVATVLTPTELKPGALHVSAPGQEGKNGRQGRRGSSGDECQNGEDGEDGEPGEPGQPGGVVNVIAQTGVPWLSDLVWVSNAGGRGGAGGAGGAGGSAGIRSGRPCSPRDGRNGRGAAPGPDGPHGPPEQTTSVPLALLWPGSPIWSDAPARRALEALIDYASQRAR
ncbi:MAG: hypothetical protein ACREPM_00030 [Gemmatimonadaceae bacterium]